MNDGLVIYGQPIPSTQATDAEVAAAIAADTHSLRGSRHTDPSRATGVLAETYPRLNAHSNTSLLATGRLHLGLCPIIEAGTVISNISFESLTTPANAPTNQWFALYDYTPAGPVLLATTADDLTTAWSANSVKTLAIAKNAAGGTIASYTIPTTARYYLGIMVKASTVPTLACLGDAGGVILQTPILTGFDNTNTGLTTPSTAPNPAAALTTTAVAGVPYAYVS